MRSAPTVSNRIEAGANSLRKMKSRKMAGFLELSVHACRSVVVVNPRIDLAEDLSLLLQVVLVVVSLNNKVAEFLVAFVRDCHLVVEIRKRKSWARHALAAEDYQVVERALVDCRVSKAVSAPVAPPVNRADQAVDCHARVD